MSTALTDGGSELSNRQCGSSKVRRHVEFAWLDYFTGDCRLRDRTWQIADRKNQPRPLAPRGAVCRALH